jgi:hypothetical protein
MPKKGQVLNDEQRKSISVGRLNRKQRIGYLNSPETRKKISLALTGRKQSKETIEKRMKNMIGRKVIFSAQWIENLRKGHIGLHKESNNPMWKGNKASKSAMHKWMDKNFGKPKYCEICKRTDRKQYDWSNKDHTYKRDRKNWQRLCSSCHKKYDIELKKENNKKHIQADIILENTLYDYELMLKEEDLRYKDIEKEI